MESLDSNPIIEPQEDLKSPTVEIQSLVTEQVLMEALPFDDDDCLICYQTIYRPARTDCGHFACESCMLHWALAAMDTKVGAGGPSDLPPNLAIEGIKFKCSTCRTYTQAKFDMTHNDELEKRHAEEYATRAAEFADLCPDTANGVDKTMVLMFGNSYRKVEPSVSPYTGKIRTHEWTFFIKSTMQDIIEKVEVILHPTYKQDRLVTLTKPPFATTHLAWGYFTVFCGVLLKEGWEWVDEQMVVDSDAKAGRLKDRLPLQWMLDFSKTGSFKTKLLTVRPTTRQMEKGKDPELVAKKDIRNVADNEEDEDLDALAGLMSAREIKQLKEVRRLKRQAMREN